MKQFSLTNILSPDGLLIPAIDPTGRSGTYRTVYGASRIFVVCHFAQGNAATITVGVLQAKDTSGTGSKAIATAKIYTNENVALGSGNIIQQADGVTYTTGATLAEKLVIFELDPADALDVNNAYNTITVATGASNPANITSAELYVYGSYLGVSGLGLD